MLDYVELFEVSVNARIKDMQLSQTENTQSELRPVSLLMGIALGIVAAKFTGLIETMNQI